MKKRVYWLRHKIIRWIDQFSSEQLEIIAWFSMMFLLAAYYWFMSLIGS